MTYTPPIKAIEWYRKRFALRLSEIESSMEAQKDTMTEGEYAAVTKTFRILRHTLLPPTDGCVVEMFDPRMYTFRPMPKPAELDSIVADPLRGNSERGWA